jgi:type IV secretory pathway VirB10-like protein
MSLSHLPRLPLAAVALCAALALSACGGPHNKKPNQHQPPPPTTPPPRARAPPTPTAPPPAPPNPAPPPARPRPAPRDSFFDFVLARVNAMIDNEEPAAIDGLTESKPENTEPVPVS